MNLSDLFKGGRPRTGPGRRALPARLAGCVVPLLTPLHSPAQAVAASSVNYSITPSETGGAGLRSASAAYTVDFSSSPGVAAESVNYRLRTGWSGLLYDFTGLNLSAVPNPVPEVSTAQLTASFQFDDGATSPLTAQETAGIVWTIQAGSAFSISPAGVITTAAVYQNTAALAEASVAGSGATGALNFTVTDTNPDNYPGYAADGLPDDWQIRYFPSPANGSAIGQNGDYDHDSISNFLEYAFGTDPASAASGAGNLLYADGVLTSRGQPVPLIANIPNSVDFRVVFSRRRDYLPRGLLYKVQFSADLRSWSTTAATPLLIARDAEYEAVSVPWPLFVNGRKARFFRVVISSTP